MSRHVEEWCLQVEQSMKTAVKKHMKNAILRFTNQPMEEWVLDYPQQVSISVIHLIISQEVNEILSHVELETWDTNDHDPNLVGQTFLDEKVTISNK